MYLNVFTENFVGYMPYHKKQVRFITPNKSDSRLIMNSSNDCQEPRPFQGFKTNHTLTENLRYSHENSYQTAVYDYEKHNSSPYTLLNKKSISCSYKPSKDLELSMLDSSFTSNESNLVARNKNQMSVETMAPRQEKESSFFITPDSINNTVNNFSTVPFQQKKGLSLPKPIFKQEVPELRPIVSYNKISNTENICSRLNSTEIPKRTIIDEFCQNKCLKQKSYCICSMKCCDNGNLDVCCTHACPVETKPLCNFCQSHNIPTTVQLDAVALKTQNLEKYQNNYKNLQVQETDSNKSPKSEPSVRELFKIIKLQNEQLQLLQKQVDKLVTNISQCHRKQLETNKKAVEYKESDHMSIGVMTSFEMVRTSTYMKQEMRMKGQNLQIQSDISIKEVYTQAEHSNKFLDGINPVAGTSRQLCYHNKSGSIESIDEKTMNDLSLHNLQIDTSETPQRSPEPSINVDINDYSDSEEEQSNAGWTFYDRVMTHVDEILENQPQVKLMNRHLPRLGNRIYADRTECSVTTSKRVTFGDQPMVSPAVVPPNKPTTPSTDLSMQMNKLANKYLINNNAVKITNDAPIATEMSLASRNYVEQYNILPARRPQSSFPSRFLDITSLKRQPKLL